MVFFLYLLKTAAAAAAKLLQSCPTLCDPIDGSPAGSPVPGILQARTLEWVATEDNLHECRFFTSLGYICGTGISGLDAKLFFSFCK